jgi:hypothetical protein
MHDNFILKKKYFIFHQYFKNFYNSKNTQDGK